MKNTGQLLSGIRLGKVRASHGSSVGKIDPAQLFYLRSRGVNPEESQKILLSGFFGEMMKYLDKVISSNQVAGDRLRSSGCR